MNKMCWVWSIIKREQCPEQTLPARKPSVKETQRPENCSSSPGWQICRPQLERAVRDPSLRSTEQETGQQGGQSRSCGVSQPWLLCASSPAHLSKFFRIACQPYSLYSVEGSAKPLPLASVEPLLDITST